MSEAPTRERDAAPTRVDTDVLVVGSGPAGAAMALALSTLGVDHVVITRSGSLAAEPRAHVISQRTTDDPTVALSDALTGALAG